MGIGEGFLYGVLGGIFAQVLGIFRLREHAPSELPAWVTSWFYWLITLFMVVAGGMLVFVYLRSGLTLQPVLAVNVGASAPLVIANLVAQAPKVEPGKAN